MSWVLGFWVLGFGFLGFAFYLGMVSGVLLCFCGQLRALSPESDGITWLPCWVRLQALAPGSRPCSWVPPLFDFVWFPVLGMFAVLGSWVFGLLFLGYVPCPRFLVLAPCSLGMFLVPGFESLVGSRFDPGVNSDTCSRF